MANWAELKFQQASTDRGSIADEPKPSSCSVNDLRRAIAKKNLPDMTIRWHFAKELEELTEEERVIAQAHIASLPKLAVLNYWQFKDFPKKEGVPCRILIGEHKGAIGWVGKGDSQSCLYEVWLPMKRCPIDNRILELAIVGSYSLSQLELYPKNRGKQPRTKVTGLQPGSSQSK